MASRPKTNSLVGHFFHSVDPETGKVQWQGVVVGNPEEGWYLLQLFDWLVGEPSVRRLVYISEMNDWLFYDIESMKYSWQHGTARPGSSYQNREAEYLSTNRQATNEQV